MLTSFRDLYCNDFMLPTGNLREWRSGAQRANIVIVTKCPHNLSLEDQNTIKQELNLNSNQSLFFTFIEYDEVVYSYKNKIKVTEVKVMDKLLLAGIAKP